MIDGPCTLGRSSLGVLDVRNANVRGSRQFGLLVRADGAITGHRHKRRRGQWRNI
jgi:hypothetical protein